MSWTPNKLADYLEIDRAVATRIIGLLRGTEDWRAHPAVVSWADQCHHDPREGSHARQECLMHAFNAELNGCGVEAIRGRYVDRYYQDVQATYVNQGDTYAPTILHDHERGVFLLTTFGDWVEKYGERREVA